MHELTCYSFFFPSVAFVLLHLKIPFSNFPDLNLSYSSFRLNKECITQLQLLCTRCFATWRFFNNYYLKTVVYAVNDRYVNGDSHNNFFKWCLVLMCKIFTVFFTQKNCGRRENLGCASIYIEPFPFLFVPVRKRWVLPQKSSLAHTWRKPSRKAQLSAFTLNEENNFCLFLFLNRIEFTGEKNLHNSSKSRQKSGFYFMLSSLHWCWFICFTDVDWVICLCTVRAYCCWIGKEFYGLAVNDYQPHPHPTPSFFSSFQPYTDHVWYIGNLLDLSVSPMQLQAHLFLLVLGVCSKMW